MEETIYLVEEDEDEDDGAEEVAKVCPGFLHLLFVAESGEGWADFLGCAA